METPPLLQCTSNVIASCRNNASFRFFVNPLDKGKCEKKPQELNKKSRQTSYDGVVLITKKLPSLIVE